MTLTMAMMKKAMARKTVMAEQQAIYAAARLIHALRAAEHATQLFALALDEDTGDERDAEDDLGDAQKYV